MYKGFILCTALLTGLPLTAQQTNVTVEQVDFSALANGIISEAAMARESIKANDQPGAMAHVGQAMSAATRISQFPHPELIPVSIEVETTSTYSPVKHGKGEMTAKRLKRRTNIRDATAEIKHSSLNVQIAQARLESAHGALEQNDLAAADRALAGVQNDAIVWQSASQNVPLLRARQNLELARARVLEGKYSAAVAPLRSAAQALFQFERQSPGPLGQNARSYAENIDAYANQIRRDHTDALKQIDEWLDPVRRWYSETAQ